MPQYDAFVNEWFLRYLTYFWEAERILSKDPTTMSNWPKQDRVKYKQYLELMNNAGI